VEQLSAIGYPDRNAIAIDDQGRPYMSYYDAGRGVLRLAHQDGPKWVTETVDSGGAGFTSSLEVVHGTLWISYADEAHSCLKVARMEQEVHTLGRSQLSESR
jgi:hypothetical protein